MDPDHVINMGQTPIPFTFHYNCTWNTKGLRTVHAHSFTSGTNRAMLAAIVTMSSKLLPPFLIFKGSPNSQIAKNEIATYPDMSFYAMQKRHGLMNDRLD